MFIKLVLVWLLSFFLSNRIYCRDICSRYAVLKEIDTFTLAEKENAPVAFQFDSIKNLITTLHEQAPLFEKNLVEYSNPAKLQTEPRFYPLTDELNLVPTEGTRMKYSDRCADISGFVPGIASLKDLPRLEHAMSIFELSSIPINTIKNRGSLTAENGMPLGVALSATTEDPTLELSYPLLSFSKDAKGVSMYDINLPTDSRKNISVTGLCSKINKPWSRKGSQRLNWIKIARLVKSAFPEIDKLVERFTSFSALKINPNFNHSSFPVINIPVPNALQQTANLISKFSNVFEWNLLKNSDTNQFTNLISNLKSIKSLFLKNTKQNKFSQNKPFEFEVPSIVSNPDLRFLTDSTQVLDSRFQPVAMLDSDKDGTGDLVAGQLSVVFNDQQNLVRIFQVLPLFFKDQQVKSTYLIQAKDSSLSLTLPRPSGCVTNEAGNKICKGLSFDLVRNMSLCINALTGVNEEIQHCPLQTMEPSSIVAHRVDCMDNFNLVIDSRIPLELAPVCNGNTNKHFKGQYFPLYLDTDCAIKVVSKDGDFTLLPQIEKHAETENFNPEPFYPYQSVENMINSAYNFFNDPSINGAIKIGTFFGISSLIMIAIVIFIIVCIFKFPDCCQRFCRYLCEIFNCGSCTDRDKNDSCCRSNFQSPKNKNKNKKQDPIYENIRSKNSQHSDFEIYDEPIVRTRQSRRNTDINLASFRSNSSASAPPLPAMPNAPNPDFDISYQLQDSSPFLVDTNTGRLSKLSKRDLAVRGEKNEKVHRRLNF